MTYKKPIPNNLHSSQGILGLGEHRASFETDLSREARCKGDAKRASKNANKGKGKNKSKAAKVKFDPLAPKGQPIGSSSVRLWKKDRFESGEKKLNKTQRRAGQLEWAKTGYTFPLYARECVLGPIFAPLPMCVGFSYATECVLGHPSPPAVSLVTKRRGGRLCFPPPTPPPVILDHFPHVPGSTWILL